MVVGTREQVWSGAADKTSGGLRKQDLMMGPGGKIVSIRASAAAKARMKGRGASAVGSTSLDEAPVSVPPPIARADSLPVPRDAVADRVAVANADYRRAALRVAETPEALTKKAVAGRVPVVSGLSIASAVAHGDSAVVDADLVARQLVSRAGQRGAAGSPLSIADLQAFIQRIARAPVDAGELQRLVASEGVPRAQLALPAPPMQLALPPPPADAPAPVLLDVRRILPEEAVWALKEELGPEGTRSYISMMKEAADEDSDIGETSESEYTTTEASSSPGSSEWLSALSEAASSGEEISEGEMETLLDRLRALRESDVPEWSGEEMPGFIRELAEGPPLPELPEEAEAMSEGLFQEALRAPQPPSFESLGPSDDEGDSPLSGAGVWRDLGRLINRGRKVLGRALQKKEAASLLNSLAAISGRPELVTAARLAPAAGALLGSGTSMPGSRRPRLSSAAAMRVLRSAALVNALAKKNGAGIGTALKIAAPILGRVLRARETPAVIGALGKALGGRKGQRVASDITRRVAPLLATLLGGGVRLPGAGVVLPGSGVVLPGSGVVLPGSGVILPGAGPTPKFWRAATKALTKASRSLGRALKRPEARTLLLDVAKIAGVDPKYSAIAADMLPQFGGLLGGGPMSAKAFFESVGRAFKKAAPAVGKVLRRKEVGDIARTLGAAFGRPEIGKAAADIAGSVGGLLGGAAVAGRGVDEGVVASFTAGMGAAAVGGAGSRGGVCGAGFVRTVGSAIEGAVAQLQPADRADIRRVAAAIADVIGRDPVRGRGESWTAGRHQAAVRGELENVAEGSSYGPAYSARTAGQERGGRGVVVPGAGAGAAKKKL